MAALMMWQSALGLAYWQSTLTPPHATAHYASTANANAFFSEPFRVGWWEGFLMTLATTALTILLELSSMGTLRKLLRSPEGSTLYAKALFANVFNNFALGPVTYATATRFLCSQQRLAPLACARATVGLLLVQSVGYYAAHWAMHRRSFYWAHKFHHKFAEHVIPMAANAVSPAEYAVAYMLPIVAGIGCFAPDANALAYAVALISGANILIHTPPLERMAEKYLPWWLVGTDAHLTHHRKLNTNFAAPTLNVDALLAAAVVFKNKRA